jgi:hypothetical protein
LLCAGLLLCTLTITLAAPDFDAEGVTAVHVVIEPQSTDVAGIFSNVNSVSVSSGANTVPVSVTVVPPAIGPEPGVTLVTVGSRYW